MYNIHILFGFFDPLPFSLFTKYVPSVGVKEGLSCVFSALNGRENHAT